VRGSGAAAIRSKAIFAKGDLNCCSSAASTRADSLPGSRAAGSSASLTLAANGPAASAATSHAATISRCEKRGRSADCS
jgi:hypothetical protein